jgi:hypothetical protein
MPATNQDQYSLTEEQKQHWLEHGFIKLTDCFSREAAEQFTSSVWTRVGASPDDKSTWPTEKLNMPGHTKVPVKDFAPKAYYAIADLVGGEDKIADWCKDWKDGWIVNFGKPEFKPTDALDVRTLDNWHNDGDWFVHFLDSPEQALLVIPLFSDIEPKGGGTVICTDGIGLVAKHLVRNFVSPLIIGSWQLIGQLSINILRARLRFLLPGAPPIFRVQNDASYGWTGSAIRS